MKQYRFVVAMVGFMTVAGIHFLPVHGQEPAVPQETTPVEVSPADAGIRAVTAAYVLAFNKADAKAAARLWTTEGEYIGSDGETVRGRTAIEKSLTEYFQANPHAQVAVKIASVTPMARGLASVQGEVTLKITPESEPALSLYNALHVQEDGVWRAASVREWATDPATDIAVEHLGWLIGKWTANGPGGELTIAYTWGDAKKFITGEYQLIQKGKPVSSGKQIFGTNPQGGLRSWSFDSSGTTTDGIWYRDEKRWINESAGTLPDGTTVNSLNVLIPLGPDAFTWQTAERTIDDVPVEALPPVKVTRVKH